MAAQYKLTRHGAIIRLADGASFLPSEGNLDYQQYLADAAAGAEVAPPDPAPLVYDDSLSIRARLRTTNATPTELYRSTLAPLTGYRAGLTLIAVDAGNGACRTIEARVTAKRLAGGALLVGAPAVVSDQQDGGTAAWAITAAVSGNDFIITVTGAAGRNIDWLLDGSVVGFTPGGR